MEASITPNFGLIQLLIVLGSLAIGVFAGGWLVGLKIQKLIKTGKLLRVEDHENTMRELVSNLRFGHNVNEANQEYDKLFNHGIAQQQLAADLIASENAENAPITFRPPPIGKPFDPKEAWLDDVHH